MRDGHNAQDILAALRKTVLCCHLYNTELFFINDKTVLSLWQAVDKKITAQKNQEHTENNVNTEH